MAENHHTVWDCILNSVDHLSICSWSLGNPGWQMTAHLSFSILNTACKRLWFGCAVLPVMRTHLCSRACSTGGFPGSTVLKNLPAVQKTQETWVQSLGREDTLENEMAIHSRILAWKIPWTEEPGGLQSMGSQRVRHDWAHTRLAGWAGSRRDSCRQSPSMVRCPPVAGIKLSTLPDASAASVGLVPC